MERRFNGPPDSANGGYACGVAARALGAGAAEVSLRRPPPLDVPMAVVDLDGGIELQHDGSCVAAARPWSGSIEVPARPDAVVVDAAVAALDVDRYAADHAFGRCFTCGPERDEGDGLRIFPGPVVGTGTVVWPWVPAPSTVGDDGLVAEEVVWAALDCPSGLAWIASPDGSSSGAAVLGRLAARVDRRPEVGEGLLVAGWQRGAEGRRRRAGSAVWDADGVAIAVAEATWVVLDETQAAAFGARS